MVHVQSLRAVCLALDTLLLHWTLVTDLQSFSFHFSEKSSEQVKVILEM